MDPTSQTGLSFGTGFDLIGVLIYDATKSTLMKQFAFIAIIIFTSFSCIGQELNTDRPDQSDGASIVKKGKVQLESSFSYTAIGKTDHPVILSNLVRLGMSKRLELRLLVEQGYKRNIFIDETAHSQYPLAAGFKVALIEENEKAPGVSVIGAVQLPFTNSSQPKLWSPMLAVITEKKWSPVTITVNVGTRQEAFSHEWALQATTDVKYELTNKWQIFGEYFAQYGAAPPFHNIDAGILFHPAKYWMLFSSVGEAIHHSPHIFFISSGFAIQFK